MLGSPSLAFDALLGFGVEVDIRALEGKPELNGRRGRISVQCKKSHWGVSVDGYGKLQLLKAAKLRVALP